MYKELRSRIAGETYILHAHMQPRQLHDKIYLTKLSPEFHCVSIACWWPVIINVASEASVSTELPAPACLAVKIVLLHMNRCRAALAGQLLTPWTGR